MADTPDRNQAADALNALQTSVLLVGALRTSHLTDLEDLAKLGQSLQRAIDALRPRLTKGGQ